jgi:hypothetical protein
MVDWNEVFYHKDILHFFLEPNITNTNIRIWYYLDFKPHVQLLELLLPTSNFETLDIWVRWTNLLVEQIYTRILKPWKQHNTTQHNTTQHNTTQHNTTQHNTTHAKHNTVLVFNTYLTYFCSSLPAPQTRIFEIGCTRRVALVCQSTNFKLSVSRSKRKSLP